MQETKFTVAENLSGIQRAIIAAGGTQAMLAERLVQAGDRVDQSLISRWLAAGYVPTRRAILVSHVTDIPIADLLKPRKARNGKATRD